VQHTVYLFEGFQLDVTRRKLSSAGGLVLPLNSRAMDALLLLVANAGELVEKRRLMQTIWPHAVVEENNLNQCILAIRKALGETAGSNRFVRTEPGRGYRFVSPVRRIVQESDLEAPLAASSAAPAVRLQVALGLGAVPHAWFWVGLLVGAVLTGALLSLLG
jgi:DNA-binding winged helix-turn-helix (wHTH) protein